MNGDESKVWMVGGRRGAGLLFLALGAATAPTLGGPVIYVNQNATGVSDGSSWGDAYTDLQLALDAAEASGGALREIWVAAGSYKPSQRTDADNPRSATFQLINGVSLYGGFAGTETSVDERDIEANETILSGDVNGDDQEDFVNYDENAYHVVMATDVGNATIFDGLIVTAGHAPGIGFLGSYGGGIHLENAHPTIHNCTFTRNLAERPANVAWSGGGGAALFLHQEQQDSEDPGPPPLNVSQSRFTDNRSAGDGGAVFIFADFSTGSVIFSECSFERNVGNGAFSGSSGSVYTFHSCTFSDNSSEHPGGAISTFIFRGELLIERCHFVGNTAPSGGAVYWNGGRALAIHNSVFVDNSAESGNAGALLISGADMVQLIDSEFRGNSAQYAGGAQLDWNGSTTVRRCQFVDNSANDWEGGGLYVYGSGLTNVTECTFGNNHARDSGGGLFILGPVEVTRCTFTNNNSWGRGGGAFAYSSYGYGMVSFEDTVFNRNLAEYGGAIYIGAGSRVRLDRCRVEDNDAWVGGGLATIESSADVLLVSSQIASNHAEAYGGGVAAGNGTLSVQNCTIANNTADALGAGMIAGHDTTVTNSVVWGNVADPDGGAWMDEVAQIEGIEFAAIDYSDVQGWSGAFGGEGNIGIDPLFVEPVDPDGPYEPGEPDFRLRPDSPCINAGFNAPIPMLCQGEGGFSESRDDLDLDSHSRILCEVIDMGAYEFGIGDVDCDNNVGLDDFADLFRCIRGPAVYGCCYEFMFDADNDIDLHDFAQFSRVFSPGSP